MHNDVVRLTGILLAAGRGTRFDPSGAQDKLQQILPDGRRVAVTAARNLLSVLPKVLAVVRPEQHALAAELRAIGCEVTVCQNANEGMAASLVHALSQARDAAGWLIALADMPHVQSRTMAALSAAIQQDTDIAVPIYRGLRGNPVAFGRAHLHDLLALRGDQGARQLLKTRPLTEVVTDDPGIVRDIDTVADLAGVPLAANGSDNKLD
ncbi:MAG TPA: nucleotidyltransferase family protein [Noviherbaspirillum sp.]|uniref:nucleotidyltransferase family protein n=1 Tax=Noviherbaspirillum sp. TaxID=1926288 RepID=UPI002B49161F|nr:nucleotidyltransferase family protein [Noviherbaspirillum sp.]HJV86793.1 nucleotidyltransferase family protein [Noviherbaspirillum sp.]